MRTPALALLASIFSFTFNNVPNNLRRRSLDGIVDITQIGIPLDTIVKVRARMLESANASWELGTACEALTELSWPSLSVFRPTAFPPPLYLNSSLNASDIIDIALRVVRNRPQNILPLVTDDSVGDPASLGPAVLLANYTKPDKTDTELPFAIGQQLGYLLLKAPRDDSGAISHRVDQVQLWADFVYMAPPFIAYFAIFEGGGGEVALLRIAYDQCRLYRDFLRDPNPGLWRHVVLGNWQDNSHWATGNAWAAAGMLRVRETIRHSKRASDLVHEQGNLTVWIQEILNATLPFQRPDGLIFNTIDAPSAETFPDTASTALLGAVAYRMASLINATYYLPFATRALNVVYSNIDSDGWLNNAVDPYTFNTPLKKGDHSPEGQAFVLLLQAAWRDSGNFANQINGPQSTAPPSPSPSPSRSPVIHNRKCCLHRGGGCRAY